MRSGKTATRKVIGAMAIGRKPPRQRPSRTATTARCERRGRVLHTDRSRCRGDTSGLSGGSLEGDPRHAGGEEVAALLIAPHGRVRVALPLNKLFLFNR